MPAHPPPPHSPARGGSWGGGEHIYIYIYIYIYICIYLVTLMADHAFKSPLFFVGSGFKPCCRLALTQPKTNNPQRTPELQVCVRVTSSPRPETKSRKRKDPERMPELFLSLLCVGSLVFCFFGLVIFWFWCSDYSG